MARYFPGARSAYLKLTDSVNLEFYPCTMTAWAKFDSNSGLGGSGTVFARYYDNAATQITYDGLFYVNASAIQRAEGARASGGTYFLSTATGDTNWHHFATVMHGYAYRSLYIDGVLVSSSATGLTAFNQPSLGCGAIEILNAPADKGAFVLKGSVADCAMWTTALSPYEIQQLANKQLRPGQIKRNQLKGWWPLTQGGDLNSVVPYLPFTQFGAVTEVADPPSLPPIEVEPTEYERDLVYTSDTSPEANTLGYGLHSALPITEKGAWSLSDPILRTANAVALLPLTAHPWLPDGGVQFGGGGGGGEHRPYAPFAIRQEPLSVSCWCRAINVGSSGSVWALSAYPAKYATILNLAHAPNGPAAAGLSVHGLGGVASIAATTVMPASGSAWQHAVVVAKRNELKIYINGKLEGTSSTYTPSPDPYTWFGLAYANPTLGNRWYGDLRDLRIWNRLLNDREVFELYRRGYAKSLLDVRGLQ